MIKALILSLLRRTGLSALAGLALCLHVPLVAAQSLIDEQSIKNEVENGEIQPIALKKRGQANYETYVLGPGDGLLIELLDLPELSGRFSIGPDGNLYLPRLRSLYVEGLTVEELRHYLTEQFSAYVLEPKVYVSPVVYRPVRIYVGGEVKRPGYYTLTGAQSTSEQIQPFTSPSLDRNSLSLIKGSANLDMSDIAIQNASSHNSSFSDRSSHSNLLNAVPTVFDAIRKAQGITPFSDLTRVQVTRKLPEGRGGGQIRTNLNFFSLITEGNESQNIRLFDGDVVTVKQSKEIMSEQLLKASQTNLSPQFIKVFVSGRVKQPGGVTLPQGSSLNQALAVAGGTRLIKGRVEFVRFTKKGETDRRIFAYNPGASAGSNNNPLLSAGDLIRVQDSLLSATTTVLDEITAPAVGMYTIFSLLERFN